MDEIRVPYGDSSAHFNVLLSHAHPGIVLLDTGDIPEFELTPKEANDLGQALISVALAAIKARGDA